MPSLFRWSVPLPLTLAALALLGATPAHAQQMQGPPPGPYLTGLTPVSGARGSVVEITLAGKELSGARGMICRYSAFPKLITPEPNRGLKAEVLPGGSDSAGRAKVTIAKDAAPGLHEVRVICAGGITNGIDLLVSQFPEAPEREPNNGVGQAQPITLPTTLAGTVNGGSDHDVYSFTATKGERISFEVEGLKRNAPPEDPNNGIVYLDSFLSLRNAKGQELAYNDDTIRYDPLLDYTFSEDGTYYIEVRDNAFRGRGDFFYRLVAARRPTITAVYPPAGTRASRQQVQVIGFNLDGKGATALQQGVSMARDGRTVQEFRLTNADGSSNAFPLLVSPHIENTEAEKNNTVAEATRLTLPAAVSGRADQEGDVDCYRFQAQGQSRIAIHVEAAELGSTYDSFLTLMDTTGRILAVDDDGAGMPDARIVFTAPKTDEFVVKVKNQLRELTGPRAFYRLSIGAVEPSFALTPPEPATAKQGGSTEIPINLLRFDEFGGDVQVAVSPPPDLRGITSAPLVVKNGQRDVKLRVQCSADVPVGNHVNVYLRAAGTVKNQPREVIVPFWVTVTPP